MKKEIMAAKLQIANFTEMLNKSSDEMFKLELNCLINEIKENIKALEKGA